MAGGLLAGDTALVTGTASGIGRGIARALVAEGARVLGADIDAERGGAIAAEIGADFVRSDLSRPEEPARLFAAALKMLGKVSIFVHCAAPRRREEQTALAVTAAQWDEMVNINLRSGFLLGQAAGRHMRDAGIKGRMIYMTSLHAYTPRNLPHYSASKAGQTMVMKELAKALGPHGIRVNAIAPGAIPGGGFAADVAALEKTIPMGRTGTPEDIAGMAVALLCDRFSGYVTGTPVAVDGGIALHNWITPAG
jgi:NAD(P)-dependent dehydrogenase (short-subunit alcohol dehydrogenase family)